MFFLLEVFRFFHPHFQSRSPELCAPYLKYICKGLLKLEHEQLGGCGLWLLSFYEHAAWSKMAQVLLIYLSSHSLVVVHRSPAQLEAEVKQLCYIVVIRTMSCSRKGNFCNRQEVCAFINLNDQGYRTLSSVEMLSTKVRLNFHAQAFHFVIKGGLHTMMLLRVCSASIRLLHEHSSLHCHLSSVVLVRRQCFGRCCFCTVFNWRLQTATENLQIYFRWIIEHLRRVSCECPSVLHLVHQRECRYWPSRNNMVPWTCNQSDFCLADRKHSKPQNQHNILRGVKTQNVYYFT